MPKPPSASGLRVAVDTTVLIAGFGWPRWSHEILMHALRHDYRLVLSSYLFDQAQRWFQKNSPSALSPFANFLTDVGYEWVREPTNREITQRATIVRHANDVPIALAFINAKVDYFVSEDKDFPAEDATTEELRRQLKVMPPVIFLREVTGWSSEGLEKIRHRHWPIKES